MLFYHYDEFNPAWKHEKYNCAQLINAAKEITRITTGKPPHPKQVLYGERAKDSVFDFIGVRDFNLAGVETPNGITTLATMDIIIDRLENLFGKNPQFNEAITQQMKELMLTDLRSGRKEEYNSAAGLADLFDRAGGKLTGKMSDVISYVELKSEYHKLLIEKVREEWDFWDQRETKQNDDCLQFDSTTVFCSHTLGVTDVLQPRKPCEC